MVLEVLECSWEVACAHGLEASHCGLLIVGASWCGSLKAFGLIRGVGGLRCVELVVFWRQSTMRAGVCWVSPGFYAAGQMLRDARLSM